MESVTVLQDEAHQRQQHRRYITYNVGVWVLVLLAGALALVVARQYGNSLTARHQAGLDVQAGAALFAEGNSFQSERVWLQAIDAWPGAVNALIAEHHKAIVGMPLVLEAIEDIRVQDPQAIQGLNVLKLHLLESGPIVASENLLEAYSLRPAERRTASLWLARLALGQGELALALPYFETAWKDNAAQREALHQDIVDAYATAPLQRLDALIHNGLWEEAVATLEVVLDASVTPSAHALALQGLLREIDGDETGAMASYDATLELLPNHRLAQQGRQRLQENV